MCEFVSWIEDKGNVLFLTATDLKTPRGLKIWKQIKDDITGHGAIRAYYSKDGIPMEGGVNQECTDFSSPKNFPIEIQKALVNGAFIGMNEIPKGLLSDTLDKKYSADIAFLDKKYNADRDIMDKEYDVRWAILNKKYNADKAALDKKYLADIAPLREKYLVDKKYDADKATLDKKYNADIAPFYKKFLADRAPLNEKYNSDGDALDKKHNEDIDALSKKYWPLLKDPKNRSKAWREV